VINAALEATVQPPPLLELDHILARVLLDRFSLPGPRPRLRLSLDRAT